MGIYTVQELGITEFEKEVLDRLGRIERSLQPIDIPTAANVVGIYTGNDGNHRGLDMSNESKEPLARMEPSQENTLRLIGEAGPERCTGPTRILDACNEAPVKGRRIYIELTPLEEETALIKSRLLDFSSIPERFRCAAQRFREGLLSDDCIALGVTTSETGDLVFIPRIAGVLKEFRTALCASD